MEAVKDWLQKCERNSRGRAVSRPCGMWGGEDVTSAPEGGRPAPTRPERPARPAGSGQGLGCKVWVLHILGLDGGS